MWERSRAAASPGFRHIHRGLRSGRDVEVLHRRVLNARVLVWRSLSVGEACVTEIAECGRFLFGIRHITSTVPQKTSSISYIAAPHVPHASGTGTRRGRHPAPAPRRSRRGRRRVRWETTTQYRTKLIWGELMRAPIPAIDPLHSYDSGGVDPVQGSRRHMSRTGSTHTLGTHTSTRRT